MKCFLKNILFLYLITVLNPALNTAMAQDLPKTTSDCTSDGFSFQNKLLILNSDKPIQRIFVLHNTTQGIVMLSHDKADPGAGAGWQSKLEKDKWAMLTMGQAGFSLGCMLYSPPSIGPVDCASALSVCAIPSAVSLGNGWMVENSPWEKILEVATGRGIKM